MYLFSEVVLKYFTNALGPALTSDAATGWTNFLDLMIEVVSETARGQRQEYSTPKLDNKKHFRRRDLQESSAFQTGL